MKKFIARAYIWVLLIVMYAPLVFIAIFSFTESKVLGNWTGFSTQLYQNLLTGNMQGNASLLAAVQNTLIIAVIAALVSMMLGTIAAIGIHNLKGNKKKWDKFAEGYNGSSYGEHQYDVKLRKAYEKYKKEEEKQQRESAQTPVE